MKILLLDNHDSFTYNLAELLRLNDKCTVNLVPSDRLSDADLDAADKIIFSPGPGLPHEQTAMFTALEKAGSQKPVLGICLGHQAIALHYGGALYNLKEVVHGQPARLHILRQDHFLFTDIPQGSLVGLYHSWAVREDTLPHDLEILALSETGTIMAIAHRQFHVTGLQFHPESIITQHGLRILNNWIDHPVH